MVVNTLYFETSTMTFQKKKDLNDVAYGALELERHNLYML